MDNNISVVGCGSTGMATAAWLAGRGFAVTLCDVEEQAADFPAIRDQGGIFLEGALERGKSFLPELTCDFERALSGANVVLICVSAGRQAEILERVAGFAREGQLFLLVPGNMGAVLFRRKFDELGKGDAIAAEMSGNIWACRRMAPGRVLVAMPPAPKYVAAFPAGDTPSAIQRLGGILEALPATDIIEATLNSPNIISHVAGSILNTVQIEHKGEEFALFLDGLSESYITCTNRVEEERNRLLEAMGLRVHGEPCEGMHRVLMEAQTPPGLEWFKGLKGPSSLGHRYVTEDASCGLALLVSLARRYGTPSHFTEGCLAIAGEINRTDYMGTGRTVENLGIGAMFPEGGAHRAGSPKTRNPLSRRTK